MKKFIFSANSGEINYRGNAQSLASVNSELDRLAREAEAEAGKEVDTFQALGMSDGSEPFDNEAAWQSFVGMLKRGEILEVKVYKNKTGIPCLKVESPLTEAFSQGITPKSLFSTTTYLKTGKYVELPADEEGDKLIECSREINEELFFMLLEAGEPLKILPPHKVRLGQTIYPYLVGPGGKLRLRLTATEEVISAIRNRK